MERKSGKGEKECVCVCVCMCLCVCVCVCVCVYGVSCNFNWGGQERKSIVYAMNGRRWGMELCGHMRRNVPGEGTAGQKDKSSEVGVCWEGSKTSKEASVPEAE